MTLRRIEDAIVRLEAATRQPAHNELAEAEASNARLRAAIVLSMRQIDSLIARQSTELQP